MFDKQFLEDVYLEGQAQRRIAYGVLKSEQSLTKFYLAETLNHPETVATPSRVGLTLELLFDMSPMQILANRTTNPLSWIAEVQRVHGLAIHGFDETRGSRKSLKPQ